MLPVVEQTGQPRLGRKDFGNISHLDRGFQRGIRPRDVLSQTKHEHAFESNKRDGCMGLSIRVGWHAAGPLLPQSNICSIAHR